MSRNREKASGTLCPHCDELISRSAYYRHRSLYLRNGEWIKTTATGEGKRNELKNDHNNDSNNLDETSRSIIQNVDENDTIEDSNDEDESDNDENDPKGSDEDRNRIELWVSDEDPSNDFKRNKPQESDEEKSHGILLSMFIHLLFLWQLTFVISDKCLDTLLFLLKYFFTIFNVNIATIFPGSLYKAKGLVGLKEDNFNKHILCPKCHKLFVYEEVVFYDRHNKLCSKPCDNVLYPNHPHANKRLPCNTQLMKTVMSADGAKTFLYPYKVYCQQTLTNGLETLLKRTEICSALRVIKKNDIMYDITDGLVWQNFKDINGDYYFKDKRNLAGILNVDWFQPYKNSEHSIGAIYIAILNLPRKIRLRRENTIVVGIIPGPKEPELNINSYLNPIVDELLEFWEGKFIIENGFKHLYRFALLCISSDLPATRKCCGFMSYNARKGCSKCHYEFLREGFGENPDYSGYDTTSWIPRTSNDHKNTANTINLARHKSAKSELESYHGVRYSSLFKLPYFDPITFHVVDPMHNLLLGSAKHHIAILINSNIICKDNIEKIDALQAKMNVPSEIGRVTQSISLFKSMKSDEFKNWVLFFSLFVLKDVIPKRNFNVWQLFVRACKILLKPSITLQEIEDAHQLLVCYCKQFQITYGAAKCTPNMHMHLHLRECLLNYGPVYGFWCYSFERMNGILGSYHISNHSITIQFMRKNINSTKLVSSYETLDIESLPDISYFKLMQSDTHDQYIVELDMLRRQLITTLQDYRKTYFEILSIPKIVCLDEIEMQYLKAKISFYFEPETLSYVNRFIHTYKRISLGRDILTTKYYRGGAGHNNYVIARYDHTIESCRPAIIADIFKIQVTFASKRCEEEIMMFKLEFLKQHPHRYKYGFNCPMTIWSTANEDDVYYVPINCIQRKCSATKTKCKFDHFEVRNGRQTQFRGSDVVYFII